MDQFLRKLHETRRKQRKAATAIPPRVPKLKMNTISAEPGDGSTESVQAHSHRNILPKISSRRPDGAQTERMSRSMSNTKIGDTPISRHNSIAMTSEPDTLLLGMSQQMEPSMVGGISDLPDRKFYTLKANIDEIFFQKEEGEEDLQFQVSLALDGLMIISKLIRKTHDDRIHVADDPFTFQPQGSPVGTLLMVKLLGSRPRGETQELGTALVDLSTIPVGGSTVKVVCKLSGDGPERQTQPEVTLRLRISARRKSFTFSYLKADPVFRKAGYEVTAQGLCGFPQPYKKAGLPDGVKYSSLVLSQKISEEVIGLEIYKAFDPNGNQFLLQKYNIMDTTCRGLLVAQLDGLTDMEPGQGLVLCDAFLENMRVCVVLDIEGGTMLREAIAGRGPLPEMVASIVLRQVLHAVRFMHETRSRIHNDIDARNVLCLRTGEIRLGGFKYSMKLVGKASKFSGPFVHMAPERLLGLECSFPSDVWSIGILAMELALGTCAYDLSQFQGPNALFLFKQAAVTAPSPSLRGVGHCSAELISFADQCLHKNMRARASPPELLAHPFITKYESFLLPAGSWLTKKNSVAHSPGKPFNITRTPSVGLGDAGGPGVSGQHSVLPSPAGGRPGGRRGSGLGPGMLSPSSKMSG